jgi:UDP-N-acetylglucosamine 2-epimerase (non-hydrolysing)
MKISIILGTRPEIIKLAPIIRCCNKNNIGFFIIHTNQHYSPELDDIFFKELRLPRPNYNLNVESMPREEQIKLMKEKIKEVLTEERPDIVFVQGDTNSVLAGALAASELKIKIGHVEAGLRSYDKEMPEEENRKRTDHLSDFLFCPTENQKKILIDEGIDESKIFVTGNTIVDSLYHIKDSVLDRKVTENYFLLTLHRQETVDNKERLTNILNGLDLVHKKHRNPIIFPIHPRTKERIKEFNLEIPEGVKVTDPVGYLDFLNLCVNSNLILTDSGGVQEETCILNIPCVTLRNNTERPETLKVGSNLLSGRDPNNILESVDNMLSMERDWSHPYGDGKAAQRIIDVCLSKLK